MVTVASLWVPILLSAVAVFLASTVVHMVLRYHRGDYGRLPSEDQVMEALRRFNIPPGNYMMPNARSPKEMKTPEFLEKREKGPVALLNVMGPPSFSTSLVQWFLYCIVVSVFAAYITTRALGTSSAGLEVLRFAGCTAFAGYALALWQNTIWYKIAWTTTLKSTFDGLVYALLTGAVFAWFWPA